MSPTTLFQQLPWIGGWCTSKDEALIAPNQRTIADNLLLDGDASENKKRPGINHDWDGGEGGEYSIIATHDFWFGTGVKEQKLIGVASDGKIYVFGGETPLELEMDEEGTAWTGPLTSCSLLTYGNHIFFAPDGAENVMKYWDGDEESPVKDVPGSPPKASKLWEHVGRVFCNDPSRPDMAHYCQTSDYTKWNGEGDSGAIPIGDGDGDPVGITNGISWKGDLFVFKRTKLYRVMGYTPETFQVVKVSDSLGSVGCVVSVDQDDVFYVSDKGFHSLATTMNYGDYTSSYLSADIQKTFNSDVSRPRLAHIQGAYLSSINSVAFAVTEELSTNRKNTVTTANNALYLYNTSAKVWYRWPDVSCESICVANDGDMRRFYLGTHYGRVSKTFSGSSYDIDKDGAHVAVRRKIATGQLYVDATPYTLKAYKRFILFRRPEGKQNITVKVQVDGQAVSPENVLSFSQDNTGTPLGEGFVLGSTPLGGGGVFGPEPRTIDGVGRGCKIVIEEADLGSSGAIPGFGIEYEAAGMAFEGVGGN